MVNRVLDFLIQGHQRVIGPCITISSLSNGLSQPEREVIQQRLGKKRATYSRLIGTGEAA